jgi:K+-transporting ATPase ATPase C chain
MRHLPNRIAPYVAALRIVIALTVITGLAYPLGLTAVALLPGLNHQAQGSLVAVDGKVVGSSLIGQNFTDAKGDPLVQYFQPRPSDAGAAGYDPTASGAGNLGMESDVDTLSAPGKPGSGTLSLLSQVCGRSLAVGQFNGVSGARPYCTADGIGAVLGVMRADGLTGPITQVVSLNQECPAVPFLRSYQGVAVQCAVYGADYSKALITPIRGDAPADPVVPADAVTASGSGLDPQISPQYARLQAPRVAAARGMPVSEVLALIQQYTTGRGLGVLGGAGVNVLELNLALDRSHPYTGKKD